LRIQAFVLPMTTLVLSERACDLAWLTSIAVTALLAGVAVRALGWGSGSRRFIEEKVGASAILTLPLANAQPSWQSVGMLSLPDSLLELD
jgi:hypothetical protein